MQDAAVKTVDRVAAILRVLSERGEAGVELVDLSGETGLAKPTAHRLLAALAKAGYAFQDQGSRRYRLGAAAAALGRAAHHQTVAALARPVLDRIADATGDTAFASVREGPAAVCVARAVGAFPIKTLTLEVGDRRPLGVGAGSLALLSGLDDGAVRRAIGANAHRLRGYPGFGAAELPALVERTRRDGYALNEGRIVAAMNAVGVVVRDGAGGPAAALSLAAIRDRTGPDRLPRLVAVLQEEARRLEAEIRSGGGQA